MEESAAVDADVWHALCLNLPRLRWISHFSPPPHKVLAVSQADLEMPLLGHRQALLRAISQLPALTQGAPARSASPPADRQQHGAAASPAHR